MESSGALLRSLFVAVGLLVTALSSAEVEADQRMTPSSVDGVVILRTMGGSLVLEQRPLAGRSLNVALAQEARGPGVLEVAPNFIMEPAVLPTDPLLASQGHLGPVSPQWIGIDAQGAWQFGLGSAGVVVAVIDTGIRPHREFAGRLLPGRDFVDGDQDATDPGDGGWLGCRYSPSSWHGTHVAGLIAAAADGVGTVGVAPGIKVLPVRSLGECGQGSVIDVLNGVLWAAGISVPGVPQNPNPARIINLSLGGTRSCSSVEEAVYALVARLGVLVVVAAGNESTPASLSAPANCRNTFAVGASLSRGMKASYSNFGPGVDVYAPGGGNPSRDGESGLLSTIDVGWQLPERDGYGLQAGTSMAAPVVAGAAALLFSGRPSALGSEIASALRASATRCNGATCPTGIVNVKEALTILTSGTSLSGPVDVVTPPAQIPNVPQADPSVLQERYGGPSAVETSEATARYFAFRRELAGARGELTAVLVSQSSFADSLTASVIAGQARGVVLFTDPLALSSAARRTIEDLLIDRVTIVGGPSAISPVVEEEVKAIVRNVDRVWGESRYETAVVGARDVIKNKRFLFIASGRGFADAVAAGSVLYFGAFPLVLAGEGGLNARSQSLIVDWKDLNPAGQVVILGGNVAVPSSVEAQLAALSRPFKESDGYFGAGFCERYPITWPSCPPPVVPKPIQKKDILRIAGADRFDTAAQLSAWSRNNVFPRSSSDVAFASGVVFTDALAAAPLMGQPPFQGPILLLGTCTQVPRVTLEFSGAFKSQRIVGGQEGVCDFDAQILKGRRQGGSQPANARL